MCIRTEPMPCCLSWTSQIIRQTSWQLVASSTCASCVSDMCRRMMAAALSSSSTHFWCASSSARFLVASVSAPLTVGHGVPTAYFHSSLLRRTSAMRLFQMLQLVESSLGQPLDVPWSMSTLAMRKPRVWGQRGKSVAWWARVR